MEFSKEDIDIGGSIFWIILTLIALMGLVYLLIWSFHNNSVKGVVVGVIFAVMILAGVMLSRMKVFDLASWGDNSLSFTLGFGLYVLVGTFVSGSQSVLSVSQNSLLATIASELPRFIEVTMNVFIIPIAEELFWMIGIPFAVITITNKIGEKVEVFKSAWFQILITVIIAGSTFAFFHVGKAISIFIISAIIFRTIMIVMVYGEYNWNILKGVNLVAGFAVGAHIANNLIDTGIKTTWTVLKTEPVVMIVIVVLFGFIFLSALNRIAKFIMGKDNDLIEGN